MNRPAQLWLYWAGLGLALVWLHSLTRASTFSLVSWPLTLAVIFAFTIARPWLLFLLLMTVTELGSHLPPGVMAVGCLLPLPLALIRRRPASGLKWSFFLYVALITAVQAAWLTAAPALWLRQMVTWADVPAQVPGFILASALAAFMAIIVWREWIEPLPHHKTIPRYKR